MKKYIILHILTGLLLLSCNNGPKVITAQSDQEEEPIVSSGIFDGESDTPQAPFSQSNNEFTEDLHKVVVLEVLPASRYSYLKVNENGNEFWIAVRKQNISQGATYFYRNGLLKTNFESKEHNRVFDKIILVSNLVPEKHGGNTVQSQNNLDLQEQSKTIQKELIPTHTEKNVQHKGHITIAELVANPKNYEGQSVQLSGTCVKINPNIMNRNWIHLKDGTQDEFDLVITSNTFVQEGKKVTIKGIVNLNRDFGAGYSYDLIIENAIVIE